MKTATLTETKNNLSALIDRVRNGESILVLDRGRPVARIVPVQSEMEETSGRLSRLTRQGVVREALGPPSRELLEGSRPRTREGRSIVGVLIEERHSGR